ncbi:DUF4082 domain-containing protein [Phenylobacterium sp. LjRoot219]|uniref:N,N-dimethylformamidase beta subunit family domain-containing protein n=1 Tax=Phenylobacterium sp. LjRoot219 TaxID=3342283 RepID=UPI003ED05C0A
MASNTILLENQKPGTPKSIWDAPASNQIEGFATQFSVDNGSSVSFKINLNVGSSATAPYHIEIYRLGYYGGDGATLVTTLNNLTGRAQPNPITDSRGLVDAGNWTVSASWQTPADAVSGVYLAKLVRNDNGATNQIPFIVRDDGSTSDIVLQTSDTTWQAYNGWAGRNGQVGGSLYGGFDQPANIAPDQSPFDQDRAFAVSYNRPFIVRDGGGTYAGAQDYLFGADYAAIYFLEKNGYDVSYISGIDTDRLGVGALTDHLAYISVGHDEYWSGGQRANVEAARDSGVNLLFWSGNEVYWKTRWESSIVDGTPFRTLVSYKETKFNYSLDAGPSDYPNVDPSTQWTGTWRDTRFVGNPNAVGARPENSLTGQLFGPDGTGEFGGALDIPAAFAGLRVWRDTGVGANGAQNLAPGIIGYEWDVVPEDASRPPSLIKLSETTIPWSEILVDQGNRTEPGTATHNLSLYRDDSGALVFGAGTVFWSWGLSNQHDNSPYGANIETRALQQFTINMFADMGIQPQVADAILASQGLVRASATNDHIGATATLNNLPDTVGALSTVTISGTAADIDNNPSNADGRVAVVEVSTDNGQTWRVAQGTANWSYNWTPTVQGTYTVRVRAIDDSLNVLPNSQLASDVVTVGGAQTPDTVSLFGTTSATGILGNDGQAVELGMKFSATTAGAVTALRYWRGAGDAGDTDVRAGHLWSSTGQLLGTASFSSTAGQSGWQVANLTTPVNLTAGTTYIVSYKSADNYTAQTNYFGSTVTEPFGVLTAPSSGASGGNGVYAYGAGAVFPNQTYLASNYWVDVVFDPGGTPPAGAQIGLTTPSVSHAEGNTGVTTFDYTVTRTGSTTGASSVSWAVTGSSANPANAADFQGGLLPSGTVNFAAGETSKVITLSVVGDTTTEQNEGFTLTLANPSGATLGTATATGVITNDDGTTPPPTGVSLFGATTATGTLFNDNTAVEIGMKFSAASAGTITALRYFRAAGDANDTDTREGHLWSSTGQLLGTATFTSTAGQSGWQVANLATPVNLTAGTTYIVSYKSANNYLSTNNYFGSSVTEATGQLTAPSSAASGGNGVYIYGAATQFPNQTYLASNYWVDVLFTPSGGGANQPPAFTSPATFSRPENDTLVGTVAANDPNNNPVTYALAGGVDQARFTINAATGELRFLTAPNFEAPTDSGTNNVYNVTVSASDGIAPAVQQALTITVTDVAEPPANQPPAFTSPATFSRPENNALVGTVAASDPNGNPVTYALAGGVDQARFTLNATTGELRFVTAPDFEAPTDSGTNNVYNVTVSASDGIAAAVQQALTITVTDVAEPPGNQPPVANNDSFATGEATVLNGNVVTNDSDPNGTALTVTAVNGVAASVGTSVLLASGARLTLNASGTFSYDPNGAFNALNTGQTATDSFTYTVSDGALTASATSTVTINGVSPAGGQTLTGTNSANTLTGGTGNDSISGLAGTDQLNGGDGADTLNGGDGADLMNGGTGNDSLTGTGGPDTLIGGAGTDSLNGGGGADIFRWLAFSESSTTAPDVIMSFEGAGATGGDVIDVAALSAGTFVFNGTGAFSGGGAASIRYVAGGGVTDVQFDSGNGGAAEMIVRLNTAVTLNSGDFLL